MSVTPEQLAQAILDLNAKTDERFDRLEQALAGNVGGGNLAAQLGAINSGSTAAAAPAAVNSPAAGQLLKVGKFNLVLVTEGVNRDTAAPLLGVAAATVGYTHNCSAGKIGKAMAKAGYKFEKNYGGPAFFSFS